MVLAISLLIGIAITVGAALYFERKRGRKDWLIGGVMGFSFGLVAFYLGLVTTMGEVSKGEGNVVIEAGELALTPQGGYLTDNSYYIVDGKGIDAVAISPSQIGTVYYTHDTDAYYVRYGNDITNWVFPGFGNYVVPGTVDFYLPMTYAIGGNNQTSVDGFQPRGNEAIPALLDRLGEQQDYYPYPCYRPYYSGAYNTSIAYPCLGYDMYGNGQLPYTGLEGDVELYDRSGMESNGQTDDASGSDVPMTPPTVAPGTPGIEPGMEQYGPMEDGFSESVPPDAGRLE